MSKFQITSIKSSEEFDAYISFIDNEVKLFIDIRSMILSRIKEDKEYSKKIISNTLFKQKSLLDGFIIEKVLFYF